MVQLKESEISGEITISRSGVRNIQDAKKNKNKNKPKQTETHNYGGRLKEHRIQMKELNI